MPKCYLMIGPPCSGKSTYTKNLTEEVLSCDHLRELYFGKDYVFSHVNEEKVWGTFFTSIKICVKFNSDFVVDNTNCRKVYIDRVKELLTEDYTVFYVWFDTPLWKLKFRNYKRFIFTGKWIPKNIIKHMHNNYEKLKTNLYPSVKDTSTIIKN